MKNFPENGAPLDATQDRENEAIQLSLESGSAPSDQRLAHIYLLGSMHAVSCLGENILPRRRKARALLAYLCLNPNEMITRSRLANLLWDNVTPHQARTSFRQILHELSSAMGPLAEILIAIDRESVKFNATRCWIDARAMLSDELSSHSIHGDDAHFFRGKLLEGLEGTSVSYDQWLLAERARFTEQMRKLLETKLNELIIANAEVSQRAAAARRLIAFEPTHEGASRALMRALADMGERVQALREYERCKRTLKVSLDIEPSSETYILCQELRTFSEDGGQESVSGDMTPVLQQQLAIPSIMAVPRTRLRVGVLPFQTHSVVTENLALMLSREIAASLARVRWFDVSAPISILPMLPNSPEASYGNQPLDYAVQADITNDGEKFYITVRLFDISEYSRVVWSDNFELAADSLDRITDLVTSPIAARINPLILFIEGRRQQPHISGINALVLQSIPLMYSLEREKFEAARKLLDQATENDPADPVVAAWSAYWHLFCWGQGWTSDAASTAATARELAVKAIRGDPENAESLGIYAHICAFMEKDFDSALHYFERSLRLNPNLPFIWHLSATTYSYIGEPNIALRQLERYCGFAPFDPYFYFWKNAYAIAYIFKNEYAKAVTVGQRVTEANPNFINGYKPLIAALGHLDRRDEARPYLDKLLSLEPSFTVESFGRTYPFRKQDDRERYMKGLLLAGAPKT